MGTRIPLDDPRASQVLRDLEQMDDAEPVDDDVMPSIIPPPDTVFQLDGGYLSLNTGEWVHEFTVRELNGYDEEALARIKEPGKLIIAMVERGLVRVGSEKTSPDLLDGILAGDWDTVLLAIRIATFGEEVEREVQCESCGDDYEVTINLRNDIQHKTLDPADHVFLVKGRKKGREYKVSVATGAVQRGVLLAKNQSLAEMSTMMLKECIQEIDGKPVLSDADVRSIPLADRRAIIHEIDERRVGPNLQEVTIKCPTCGSEQEYPLDTAALFQG